jgi:hypothetical protein
MFHVKHYNASTYKGLTDVKDFLKISFGRIFGYAENSGLSGVPSRHCVPWPLRAPSIPCADPGTPRGGHNSNDQQLNYRFLIGIFWVEVP